MLTFLVKPVLLTDSMKAWTHMILSCQREFKLRMHFAERLDLKDAIRNIFKDSKIQDSKVLETSSTSWTVLNKTSEEAGKLLFPSAGAVHQRHLDKRLIKSLKSNLKWSKYRNDLAKIWPHFFFNGPPSRAEHRFSTNEYQLASSSKKVPGAKESAEWSRIRVSHTFEATESYVLSIFCPACLRYSKCATSFSKRSKEGIGGPKSTWSQHKNRLDRLDFLRKKNTWRTCRLDFFHNLAEGHAAFVEVYQLLHTTRRCLTQSHLRREAGLLAVKIFTNDGKKALAEVQLQ